jgi:serine protease Do
LAALVAGVTLASAPPTAHAFFGSDDEPAPERGGTVVLPDFAKLVEELSPSVVNISTKQDLRSQFGGPGEEPQEFFGPFERFFGAPHQPRSARSLGSGFVIDESGFIITNNHVVANADQILVRLSTG